MAKNPKQTAPKCVKLELDKSIAAYIANQELTRDVSPITCDESLVQNVMCNYIIAKKIISNLRWQEKMLCQNVCSTWRSAVCTLRKEQAHPVDFALNLDTCNNVKFRMSGNCHSEPMMVFLFVNMLGATITSKCKKIEPCPCPSPCGKEHSLLDVVQCEVSEPKNCMITVKAIYLAYLPIPNTITSVVGITTPAYTQKKPFLCGLYMPAIPNVEYHTINIKQTNGDEVQDFYSEIDKISENRIYKGILVFVTDKFLLDSVENISFLSYLKEKQRDIPYALGGCIIEDTITDRNDITKVIDSVNSEYDYISENTITIGVFTVPKIVDNNRLAEQHNFEMYSIILDSSLWSKAKIKDAISEFSRSIPHFEHSVAFKLACVGRDTKYQVEQDSFRAEFPSTPIIGCFGNGELGLNHPNIEVPNTSKKPRVMKTLLYSYSTVFVYIGWGKVIKTPVDKNK